MTCSLSAPLEALLASEHSNPVPALALEPDLLAGALRTLAVWLMELSQMLADAVDDELTSQTRLRVLPSKLANRTPSRVDQRERFSLLTQRERQVVVRLAEGLSNRQIADDLVIASSTTERHVANILNKLGMRSRAQVGVWAALNGLAGTEQRDSQSAATCARGGIHSAFRRRE